RPGKSEMAKYLFPRSRRPFGFGPRRKENKPFKFNPLSFHVNPMKRVYSSLLLAAFAVAYAVQAAEAPPPKRAEPTLEQRVADLEAYVNNGTRVADTTNNVSSKLGSYDEKANTFSPNPGPGANAWQMTSSALVLFMTLPGLALFYGGLVRRKNVLSVLAQCF